MSWGTCQLIKVCELVHEKKTRNSFDVCSFVCFVFLLLLTPFWADSIICTWTTTRNIMFTTNFLLAESFELLGLVQFRNCYPDLWSELSTYRNSLILIRTARWPTTCDSSCPWESSEFLVQNASLLDLRLESVSHLSTHAHFSSLDMSDRVATCHVQYTFLSLG